MGSNISIGKDPFTLMDIWLKDVETMFFETSILGPNISIFPFTLLSYVGG